MDGKGSYVQLPAPALKGLKEFTVEAWVKPAQFGRETVFLELGSAAVDARSCRVWLSQKAATGEFVSDIRPFPVTRPASASTDLRLQPDRWYHIAAVVQRNRLLTFINGAPATVIELPVEIWTAEESSPFEVVLSRAPGATVDPRFQPDKFLGLAERQLAVQPAGDLAGVNPNAFAGQIDEVRIWRVAREPAAIREAMFQRLHGNETDLVGLWDFDGVSAQDLTAGRNHGSLRGNAKIISAETPERGDIRIFDRVLVLDGNDSFVELPSDVFDSLSEASVEGWVRWRSFEGWVGNAIFSCGPAGQDVWLSKRTDGTPHLAFANPAFRQLSPGRQDLQLNQWYHVAAVSGNQGMRLYLNGVLIGSNTLPGSFKEAKSTGPARLGKATYGDVNIGTTFSGEIADFRVWRTDRTDDQIRENMFRKLAGNEEGLFGLWDFSDGTARDRATNHYDGVLKGSAKILAQRLPEPQDVAVPAVIRAHVTDTEGKALPYFQVQVLEEGAGFYRYDGNQFFEFSTKEGLPTAWNRAIHRAHNGTLWLGMKFWLLPNGGLFRQDGQRFVNVTAQFGLDDYPVYGIDSSTNGTLWVASQGGVLRYDGKQFTRFTMAEGLAHDWNLTIHGCSARRLAPGRGFPELLSRLDPLNRQTTLGAPASLPACVARELLRRQGCRRSQGHGQNSPKPFGASHP